MSGVATTDRDGAVTAGLRGDRIGGRDAASDRPGVLASLVRKNVRSLTPLVAMVGGLWAVALVLASALPETYTRAWSSMDRWWVPSLLAFGSAFVLVSQERDRGWWRWRTWWPVSPVKVAAVEIAVAGAVVLVAAAMAYVASVVRGDGGEEVVWQFAFPLTILAVGFWAAYRFEDARVALGVAAVICVLPSGLDLTPTGERLERAVGMPLAATTFVALSPLWLALAVRSAGNIWTPRSDGGGPGRRAAADASPMSARIGLPRDGTSAMSIAFAGALPHRRALHRWSLPILSVAAVGLSIFGVTSGRPTSLKAAAEEWSGWLGLAAAVWAGVMGVLAFVGDGSPRRLRFLTDRGVDPTIVWWGRVRPAAASGALAFVSVVAVQAVAGWGGAMFLGFSPSTMLGIGVWMFGVAGLWTILLRSTMLAALTAIPVGALTLFIPAFWGTPLGWFVAAVPLLVTRWLIRSHAESRWTWRRPVGVAMVAAALAVLPWTWLAMQWWTMPRPGEVNPRWVAEGSRAMAARIDLSSGAFDGVDFDPADVPRGPFTLDERLALSLGRNWTLAAVEFEAEPNDAAALENLNRWGAVLRRVVAGVRPSGDWDSQTMAEWLEMLAVRELDRIERAGRLGDDATPGLRRVLADRQGRWAARRRAALAIYADAFDPTREYASVPIRRAGPSVGYKGNWFLRPLPGALAERLVELAEDKPSRVTPSDLDGVVEVVTRLAGSGRDRPDVSPCYDQTRREESVTRPYGRLSLLDAPACHWGAAWEDRAVALDVGSKVVTEGDAS